MTVTAVNAPRGATLADLAELLQDQQTAKLDLVIPATKIRARNGQVVVTGATEWAVDETGATDPNGTYAVTETFDDGVAAKLDIPRAYLRRLHTDRPDMWDATVNGFLHGRSVRRADGTTDVIHPADDRVFLLRAFVHPDGRRVTRALLSDKYEIIDNIDILTAALAGVRDAGVRVEIEADLTDRRMYVRLVAPEVEVLAEQLLAGYRSPFASPDVQRAGRLTETYSRGGTVTAPIVNPGLLIQNSETGNGGWSITPRASVKVCSNGMVIKADLLRGIHLGGRKAEGIITWSADTREKELAVVTAKTRDAVKQFLDPAYVQAKLDEIARDAGVPVIGADTHVTAVAKRLAFDPAVTAGVLDHFIRGGQLTSGGVMQAVTSYAQTVDDADLAAELEGLALDALQASASLVRATR